MTTFTLNPFVSEKRFEKDVFLQFFLSHLISWEAEVLRCEGWSRSKRVSELLKRLVSWKQWLNTVDSSC